MPKDRKRIFARGLGTMEVRKIEPTADTEFFDVGYLQSTTLEDVAEMTEVVDENGNLVNVVTQDRKVRVATSLEQTSKDELDLVRNADGQVHAVRYSGLAQDDTFQYFAFDQTRIVPRISQTYQPGLRLLPMELFSIFNDTLGYSVPLYYLSETKKLLRTANLHLYVDPRLGYNSETARLLDMSGFARHGLLNSDFTTIWQQATAPKEFLRFDGVNDQVDFGDVLNDDASGDFVIEVWVRIQAANGTKEEVLSKKSLIDDNSAGYAIFRTPTSNLLSFRIASGTAGVTVSNTTTTLQNVWRHFAVAVDRDGNATPYLNGAADGTAASVAAIGSGSNTLSLFVARDGTNFGQIDVGGMRIYRFPTGGLPSNIASIISNHFNGEREFYGL